LGRECRPRYAWAPGLDVLPGRAIGGIEAVTDAEYARTVKIGDDAGTIRVRHASAKGKGAPPALIAHVSMSLRARLTTIAARLRVLFDLDAQPLAIADYLSADARLAKLVAREPGLRLPGAFDPFETSVRAVLGQQVSV